MKKTLALLLFLLVALAPLWGIAEENLLSNGGFEQLDELGDPEGWYTNTYRNEAGYSRLQITDEKAHSGSYSALIQNASLNDARYITTVRVEPNSYYRISGYVLVESMGDDGNGANFGIEDLYTSSTGLYDTDGQWQYLEWYGKTGPDQKEITLGVRLGGYSAESIGKAYFDDIELVKVEASAIPDEVSPSLWYSVASSAASKTETETESVPQKSTTLFCLLAAAFLLLCLLLRPWLSSTEKRFSVLAMIVIALLAAGLRVFLALRVAGYSVDVNCFTAWSQQMVALGPAKFYLNIGFCDYPPGYMLLCWITGGLMNAFGTYNTAVGQPGLLLVKLWPILFDLAGAALLYLYAKKRLGTFPALFLAVLYALNPAVLVNGAAWGQADSVLTFFLLVCCIFAMERKWQFALPVYVTAVLLKPQALLFGPVLLIWLLRALFSQKEKRNLRGLTIGFGASIVAAVAIILPFSVEQEHPIGWIIKLYSDTLSSYAYATLNTANWYYLLSANWAQLTLLTGLALPIATGCCALLPLLALAISCIRKKQPFLVRLLRTQNGQISLLCAVLSVYLFVVAAVGCTWSLYGYAMMALVYGTVILCCLHHSNAKHLPGFLALLLAGIYVLAVKVHERYLFPALGLFLLGYVCTRDRRLLWLMIGFSVTTFLNTAIVLDNSILYGSSLGHLNDDTLALNVILCVLNLLLLGFGAWVCLTPDWSAALKEKSQTQEKIAASDEAAFQVPESYEKMLLRPDDPRLALGWKDWLMMGVVTGLYAVLAFTNLGSTVAPQHGMVSSSAEEQIVFELEESQDFYFLYYAGVSYNSFSIAVSEDGVIWSENYPCEMREGLCYRWNYALESWTDGSGAVKYGDNSPEGRLTLHGKYLRLNAETAGLNLFEVAFRSPSGENLPASIVSHTGDRPDMLTEAQDPAALLDEQDTCVGEPGWYTGTYFDEIYHARTAYEHLHGHRPYETTHPPLGKLLMAAGIAIFGMTPFGWRFAGAFIGVLMLPALYLVTKQLLHRRSLAAAAMTAFALDLMHYTQTRIATIDSFPVFFILLSYLCMIRYMQTDVFALKKDEVPRLCTRAFWKSQIPLALSGLFMGLSIASKWIGLYSAVGLAILFFSAVWRQFRAGNFSFCYTDRQEIKPEVQKRLENAQRFTLNRILLTCGLCVVYFILVPCVIYYLSYIPYLSPTGPVTLERVIQAQISMLNYHSTPGLGMDHPFQSPWWQWPLILKPMWFAQDKFEPAGMASTIMCMGNPWIFYLGALCMLGVIVALVCKYIRLGRRGLELRHGDGDLSLYTIVIGFAAQFLPWVLVPRSMYMYHYFASVPFIILATVWWIGRIRKPKARAVVLAVYLTGAAVFFVMFFPYASGWLTSTQWLDCMKWVSKIYGGRWFNLYY